MNPGQSVFSQIIGFVHKYEFDRLVTKYKGNYKSRTFTCWDQFLSMSFAQLTYRESLRDIEACLNAQPNKLYHMGIKGTVAKTNLARANEKRDWRIYVDFAQVLISKARILYEDDPDFSLDLKNTVYALDSTTIDLCLSLFPWAKFRKHKAAIKLHTLLDLRGLIPSFIEITAGLIHDVNILDVLIPEPGSYYIMDRGYLDFERLYRLNQDKAFFVIRAKRNLKFRRLYSRKVDKTTGLRCDQIVKLTGHKSSRHYPEKLRRVKYYDSENDRYLVFLSNNFDVSALVIADSYRNRWKIVVSSQGHITQSVQVRPGSRDSGPVAWEASWRESKTVKPSDKSLYKEAQQRSRPQRAVNVDVASLHAIPVAETVYYARRQQEPYETSLIRRFSPAGYQRRHGVKGYVSTGEAFGVRRRNIVEETCPITVSGKWVSRRQGDGSDCSTVDRRAAKRAGREGSGPVGNPCVQSEAGVR